MNQSAELPGIVVTGASGRMGQALVKAILASDKMRLAGAVEPVSYTHLVTIVTPEPYIGKEITRTSADGPLRQRLARLGVRFLTEHVLPRWHGNGATVRCLLTGAEQVIPASALVMSTTNIAFDPFPETFPGKDTMRIGDCAAPRLAPYAFHEGRKVALGL